jgi:hypothetical protein
MTYRELFKLQLKKTFKEERIQLPENLARAMGATEYVAPVAFPEDLVARLVLPPIPVPTPVMLVGGEPVFFLPVETCDWVAALSHPKTLESVAGAPMRAYPLALPTVPSSRGTDRQPWCWGSGRTRHDNLTGWEREMLRSMLYFARYHQEGRLGVPVDGFNPLNIPVGRPEALSLPPSVLKSMFGEDWVSHEGSIKRTITPEQTTLPVAMFLYYQIRNNEPQFRERFNAWMLYLAGAKTYLERIITWSGIV